MLRVRADLSRTLVVRLLLSKQHKKRKPPSHLLRKLSRVNLSVAAPVTVALVVGGVDPIARHKLVQWCERLLLTKRTARQSRPQHRVERPIKLQLIRTLNGCDSKLCVQDWIPAFAGMTGNRVAIPRD